MKVVWIRCFFFSAYPTDWIVVRISVLLHCRKIRDHFDNFESAEATYNTIALVEWSKCSVSTHLFGINKTIEYCHIQCTNAYKHSSASKERFYLRGGCCAEFNL